MICDKASLFSLYKYDIKILLQHEVDAETCLIRGSCVEGVFDILISGCRVSIFGFNGIVGFYGFDGSNWRSAFSWLSDFDYACRKAIMAQSSPYEFCYDCAVASCKELHGLDLDSDDVFCNNTYGMWLLENGVDSFNIESIKCPTQDMIMSWSIIKSVGLII